MVSTRSCVHELQGQRALCGEQSTCHQEKLSLDASATAGKISTKTCQHGDLLAACALRHLCVPLCVIKLCVTLPSMSFLPAIQHKRWSGGRQLTALAFLFFSFLFCSFLFFSFLPFPSLPFLSFPFLSFPFLSFPGSPLVGQIKNNFKFSSKLNFLTKHVNPVTHFPPKNRNKHGKDLLQCMHRPTVLSKAQVVCCLTHTAQAF